MINIENKIYAVSNPPQEVVDWFKLQTNKEFTEFGDNERIFFRSFHCSDFLISQSFSVGHQGNKLHYINHTEVIFVFPDDYEELISLFLISFNATEIKRKSGIT